MDATNLIGTALIAMLVAAVPTPTWHTLVTDFGFPIALVLFFVWNSWKREERIANRVTQLETFVQTELLDINKQAVLAIADNTAALNRLVGALENRPCLCEGTEFVTKMTTLIERIDSLADKVDQAHPVGPVRPEPA